MSKSTYRLAAVENKDDWNAFVEGSPQFTLCSHTAYLDVAVPNYALYFVCKGQQKKAGVALVLNADGSQATSDTLVIYNGILFNPDPEQKVVRSKAEEYDITCFVIEQLTEKYDSLTMALSPEFEDLRPFLWHNYHATDPTEKFNVSLRYTSYLDISSFFLKNPDPETLLYTQLDNIRQSTTAAKSAESTTVTPKPTKTKRSRIVGSPSIRLV